MGRSGKLNNILVDESNMDDKVIKVMYKKLISGIFYIYTR